MIKQLEGIRQRSRISNHTRIDWTADHAPLHDGTAGLGNHLGLDQEATDFPISLYKGEKRETVTDLSLNTPAGALAFTRTYRQSKQATYTFMGLGWTHNHSFILTKIPSTPNRIVVQMDNAAEVHFTETSPGTNVYAGAVGSTATLSWDGTRYVLLPQDKTQYVFDTSVAGAQLLTNVVQITSRVYPSSETLIYTYNSTSKKLVNVTDNYGKGYQFTYLSHPTYFDDGKLQRVDAVSSGNMIGQFVVFAYIQEMLGGSINGTGALLSTVQDVRGNVWTYQYYGQHVAETDSTQKDFLTALLSPAVDRTGQGLASSPIVVKKLAYQTKGTTITAITQFTGDSALRTDFAFRPGGLNITTQTVAGKTTTHLFNGGLYLGPQDAAGNASSRLLDSQLRPAAQIDANNHPTRMRWSTDAKFLQRVTDALGHITAFSYDTQTVSVNGVSTSADRLSVSTDAQGRTTRYSYADSHNPLLPTSVQVYDTDGKTRLRWQAFAYDSAGRTLTQQTLDPTSGLVQQQNSRTYYTGGNGNGLLQTLTQQNLVNPANNTSTTYFYDSAGRTNRTKQSATFGSCISAEAVHDGAGNVIASLCNYDPGTNPDPTTVAQALMLYNPALPDKNRVTVNVYDALGRRIQTTTDAGAPYALTTLTVYDSLSRIVRTISSYVPSQTILDPYTHTRADFSHGPNSDQNLITDTTYNERGFVKTQIDVLGNITLYGYDDAGRLIETIAFASQPGYDNSYGSHGDPSLSQYTTSSAPDQDLISANQYDPVGNLVKTTDALGNVSLTGLDALNRGVRTIRNASQPAYNLVADPTLSGYVASSAPDQDFIDYTDYDALGHVTRQQDTLGSWTLFGYDGLGRQVRVIRNASQPAYNLVADPLLSRYIVSSAPDQDLITQTAYDSMGRVLYTTDVLGNSTWSAYDGLNRVVRTVTNATGTTTDGSAHDPRSPAYSAVMQPDQDIVSTTVYDLNGYVLYTVDPLGRRTWQGYDSVGRQIRTVVNALNAATDGSAQDPRSLTYVV